MSDASLLMAAADLVGVPLRRLAEALGELVATVLPDAGCRLLVADYRHDFLVPAVDEAPDVPVQGSAGGRCYVAQTIEREQTDDCLRLWFPVSTHGDRLGVLVIEVPGQPAIDDERISVLSALAALAGRALRAGISVSDDFQIARRVRALTVTAEMQWALLPGNSYVDEHIAIAGQLEPAYAAKGDAYDWCRTSDALVLGVFDAPRGGAFDAAMRTSLAVNAFRNARRSGADLAQMVRLTDQAVFDRSRGEWHVPGLFVRLDTVGGGVQVVDAGSPAILRRRGGDVRRLRPDPQLPLGMFYGTAYETQSLDVRAGDRVLIVTDGAHGVGELSDADVIDLQGLMHQTADDPVWELTREVIAHVLRRDGDDIDDDVVAVAFEVRR